MVVGYPFENLLKGIVLDQASIENHNLEMLEKVQDLFVENELSIHIN